MNFPRKVIAAVMALALIATGCRGASSRSEDPRSDAAIRYGLAPKPDPDVKLQPDVVIVGGGGSSVRSVTNDGLTWRIDPSASKASELQKGKVMFITARGVGRVVDVQRDGDDLAVTIIPVNITEVIRDGDFAIKKPVALDDVIVYNAGEPFWAAPNAPSGEATPQAGGMPGRFAAGASMSLPAMQFGSTSAQAPNRQPQPPPKRGGGSSPLKADGFSLTPECCDGGVGAGFTYDTGGIRLLGKFKFLMKTPKASFHLAISGAKVTQAELQLSGAAGLHVEMEGATATGNNINQPIAIPIDFSIPLGYIGGIPFSVSVNQSLNVQTAFSAKDGNVKGSGDWTFGGALGFGYANGSFGIRAPRNPAITNNITKSVSGISVGVNGLIVAYNARFRVGISEFGFAAGVYFGLTAAVGLTMGSAAAIHPGLVCRGAQVTFFASYGIGYKIPQAVADVINTFLKVFNASIPSHGELDHTDPIYSKDEVDPPDKKICK